MKYKLIGNNDFQIDLKNTIAVNRGVKDLKHILNVTELDLCDYKKLKNIEEGVELLKVAINKKKRIHIITDSDNDGNTSAAIMYLYLSKIYDTKYITYHCHLNKEHGIILDELKDYDYDLLIVPDAGSNDIKQIEELYEQGKRILILDHHPITATTDKAIVINCQDGQYENPNLSGAGVVYKFCQALDEALNLKYADNYLDLVAVGMIGDMMDSRISENRYLMQEGIKNIKNKFLLALIEKQLRDKEVTIINIAFYVVPIINAIVRVGNQEEIYNMFEAFIESNRQVEYTKRGTKEPQMVYLYDDMARQGVNIKARQKREQTKLTEAILDNIDNDNVILFAINDNMDKNYSGLIANDIASKFYKPTIVLRLDNNEEKISLLSSLIDFVENDAISNDVVENIKVFIPNCEELSKEQVLNELTNKLENEKSKIVYRGSGRGYEKHLIQNLKTVVNESKLFTFAEGHESAFGLAIKPCNLQKAIEYFNTRFKDLPNDKFFTVDFVFNAKQISKNVITELESLKKYYGQNFGEPYIVVTDVEVVGKNTFVSDNGNVLRSTYNNIDYTFFFPSDQTISNLSNDCVIEVVGKAGINEFAGKTNYQIIVEDYNILDKKISENKTDKNNWW
jgi:single-stranded-DNA-specific exonuclease